MARIFVSYNRKSSEFCKLLTDELLKRDFDFWVDWEGIPPTVDWMKEIEKGIEEADTFLAIVTPEWITSKVCIDELDIAVKNGKRMIPVVPYDIVWDNVPPALAQFNFIFFTEKFDFNTQLKLLFTALDTDYDWLKTHRRLQVKALEWERSNKENGYLLRGKDLEEAEGQISINANKDPHPTDIQREYVLVSRQATDRQRRITTISLYAAVVVMLGIIIALAYPKVEEWNAKRLARGEMILIPAGITIFGTDNVDLLANGAVALQEISLSAFEVGKFEVTNRQYKLCVTYGGCTVPLEQAEYDEKPNYPVVFVTLFQANNYCKWMGQRLLTEVEWERAARGPDGKSWPWGEQTPTPDFVNMPAPGTDQPTEGLQSVDSNNGRGVSPEGVYNLIGNAYELTSSFIYSGGVYDMAYWDGISENFKGLKRYAARGGSWVNNIEYVSHYNEVTGTTARQDLGFRCGIGIK